MSWMYSDEELVKEMRAKEKEIKDSLKYWKKVEKDLFKKLWAPVWELQGKAFIEPKKHAAWKRAIKWDSLTSNLYGTYIQDTLAVMRAIELGGNEAGVEAMKHVDFGSNRVLELVEKFHRQGKNFANYYVNARPDLVDMYPELKKYVGGRDKPLTVEEVNRGNEALKEAITFTKEALQYISMHDVEKSKVNINITEMEAIAKANDLAKTASKR